MEENTNREPEHIKIIEEALKKAKESFNEDKKDQITLQDINKKLDKMLNQLNKITEAIA